MSQEKKEEKKIESKKLQITSQMSHHSPTHSQVNG